MANRKPNRLPACRHVQIGAQLRETRTLLSGLLVELSRAYPLDSRAVRAVERAQKAVNDLRSVLDGASAGELPGDAWSSSIYYGSDDDVDRAAVERVLAVHRADSPPCCAARPEGSDS